MINDGRRLKEKRKKKYKTKQNKTMDVGRHVIQQMLSWILAYIENKAQFTDNLAGSKPNTQVVCIPLHIRWGEDLKIKPFLCR